MTLGTSNLLYGEQVAVVCLGCKATFASPQEYQEHLVEADHPDVGEFYK